MARRGWEVTNQMTWDYTICLEMWPRYAAMVRRIQGKRMLRILLHLRLVSGTIMWFEAVLMGQKQKIVVAQLETVTIRGYPIRAEVGLSLQSVALGQAQTLNSDFYGKRYEQDTNVVVVALPVGRCV